MQGRTRADLRQDRQIMVRNWARACAAEPGSVLGRFRISPGQGLKDKARVVHGSWHDKMEH